MRRVIVPVAAAVALLAAPAAKAQTIPVEVTFDNAVLDTQATPDSVVVSPEGDPIRATADVDIATGAFTIAQEAFDFPLYSFSSPIPGKIDVFLNAPATGTVDFATGQVTMTADLRAEVDVGQGPCNVNTGPVQFSTENTEPVQGQRFPPGPTGVVDGPGAVAATWDVLTYDSAAPGCLLVGPLTSGPGGFWMSKGIAPPGEVEEPNYEVVALGVKASPKKKKVKKGKKATFNVRVKNPGDTDATNVKLCAKVGKGKQKCTSLGTIAAGAQKKTKVKAKAKKTSKVVFKAKGTGVKTGSAKAKVVVKKAKKKKKK